MVGQICSGDQSKSLNLWGRLENVFENVMKLLKKTDKILLYNVTIKERQTSEVI